MWSIIASVIAFHRIKVISFDPFVSIRVYMYKGSPFENLWNCDNLKYCYFIWLFSCKTGILKILINIYLFHNVFVLYVLGSQCKHFIYLYETKSTHRRVLHREPNTYETITLWKKYMLINILSTTLRWE